ncbi:MAG TPA: UvrD-helicase domain-containing protein, partial [Verrucomicrobiae bacterium]
MDTPGTQIENNSLTPSQREAVAARGNVLVMAGAGTGKTHTLVERCLDLICRDRVSLDEMLIVTFTEAAAAEVRERLRAGLEEAAGKRPSDTHLPEQLALFDAAHIGTLHGFCFKLVREHFHALNLDPQLKVLDEAQARLLADEIMEEQFQAHYEYVPESAPGPVTTESATNEKALPAAAPSPLPMVAPAQAGPVIQSPVVPRSRKRAARQVGSESELQLDLFAGSDPGKAATGAEVRGTESPSIRQSNNPSIQSLVNTQLNAPKPGDAGPDQPSAEPKSVSTPSHFSLAVQDLITVYGNGRDETIRALVLRLHHYIQTRADADAWLVRQIEEFSSADPVQWRDWLWNAVREWRGEWLPVLTNLQGGNAKAAECLEILKQFPTEAMAMAGLCGPLFEKIAEADLTENYPFREKTALRKPLGDFFEDVNFLASLVPNPESETSGERRDPSHPQEMPASSEAASTLQRFNASTTPLHEDWEWSRGHMKTLLLLAKEFAGKYSARKRADGVLDFHDLEQFAIKLLVGTARCAVSAATSGATGAVERGTAQHDVPTAIASQWREKLRFIFVDEYQDINAAQDKIISALGADNRFLVGDVKQSIYRFR